MNAKYLFVFQPKFDFWLGANVPIPIRKVKNQLPHDACKCIKYLHNFLSTSNVAD